MMLTCCKWRGYCSIPGTGTVKVLESLRGGFQKQGGICTEKMQTETHIRKSIQKAGNNSPPSKWIQLKTDWLMLFLNTLRCILVTFTIKIWLHWTRRQNQHQRNPNKWNYQLFHPALSSQKDLIPDRIVLSWNHRMLFINFSTIIQSFFKNYPLQ